MYLGIYIYMCVLLLTCNVSFSLVNDATGSDTSCGTIMASLVDAADTIENSNCGTSNLRSISTSPHTNNRPSFVNADE